jgi:predicted RNA-binding protein YlxR (DUF448 family)
MVARCERRCIFCRKGGKKEELLRFVWDGRIIFDPDQRLPGRGAYAHRRPDCWMKMGEVKRWEGAFTTSSARGKEEKSGAPGKITVSRQNLEEVMETVKPQIEGMAESGPPEDSKRGRLNLRLR